MRKTMALLALCAIFALTATAFGSPPTQKRETVKKNTQIVKTNTVNATADTSAVATRDAEARTVEVGTVVTLNESYTAAPNISAGRVLTANRYAVSPPERYDNNANGETGLNLNQYKTNVNTFAAGGFPRRI